MWSGSTIGTESSLHQLSPYIGKLKTSLARTLINQYSKPGQVILDPFSGSGVVPLESLLLGRGTIANDVNPYAAALTRGKMGVTSTLEGAIRNAEQYVIRAKHLARRVADRLTAR